LIAFKCNYTARFQRAFDKPPAGERSVLPTRGLLFHALCVTS